MTRRITDAGRTLLKRLEGERLTAYLDSAGVWTIGVGHTKTARKGMTITAEESDALLDADLEWACAAIERLVKVPLTDMQFDALVIWCFNIGAGGAGASTLVKMLNKGQYAEVPSQLARWKFETVGGQKVVSQGLVNRRAAEAELWSRGTMTAPVPVPRPDNPDREHAAQSKTVQVSGAQIIAGAGTALGGIGALDGTAQIVAIVLGGVIVALGAYLMRRRLNEWAEGFT